MQTQDLGQLVQAGNITTLSDPQSKAALSRFYFTNTQTGEQVRASDALGEAKNQKEILGKIDEMASRNFDTVVPGVEPL